MSKSKSKKNSNKNNVNSSVSNQEEKENISSQSDSDEFSLGESEEFSLGESDDLSLGGADDFSLSESMDSPSKEVEKNTDSDVDIEQFYLDFVKSYDESTFGDNEYEDYILQGNINSLDIYTYFGLNPFQLPSDADKQRILDFCDKLSAEAEKLTRTNTAKRNTIVDCIGVYKGIFTSGKSENIRNKLETGAWKKFEDTIESKCDDKIVEIDEMVELFKSGKRLGLYYDNESRNTFRNRLIEEIKKRNTEIESVDDAFKKWFQDYSAQNPKALLNTLQNRILIAGKYKNYKKDSDYINDESSNISDQQYIDNIENTLASIGLKLINPIEELEEYISKYVSEHNVDMKMLSEAEYNAFKTKADDLGITEKQWNDYIKGKNINYISDEQRITNLTNESLNAKKEKRTNEVANKILELLPVITEVLDNGNDLKAVNRLIQESSKYIGQDIYSERIARYTDFNNKVSKLHELKHKLQESRSAEQKKKRKKKIKIFIWLFVIAALGAGGFFGYKYIKTDAGKEKIASVKNYFKGVFDKWEQNRLEKQLSKLNGAIGEDYIFVEGGTFEMGSISGDSDEKPVHNVTLDSFYINKHEVTQAEWQSVMGSDSTPNYFKGEDKPVEQISWFDAVEYCNKRSVAEGLTPCYTNQNGEYTCDFTANGYRLPTEAEWEYAAKGGNKASNGNTYSGNNEITLVTWYNDNSKNTTHDVMKKEPNELGLYDMSGNVWEWCWDWYGAYSSEEQTNPQGANYVSSRVIRGGSWYSGADSCRVTLRGSRVPEKVGSFIGFRVVRSNISVKNIKQLEKAQKKAEKERLKQEKLEQKQLEQEQREKEDAEMVANNLRYEQELLEQQRLEEEQWRVEEERRQAERESTWESSGWESSGFSYSLSTFEKIELVVLIIYFIVILIVSIAEQSVAVFFVWFLFPAAGLIGGNFLGQWLQDIVNRETFAIILAVIGAIIGLVGGLGGLFVGLIVGWIVGFLLSAIIFIIIPIVLVALGCVIAYFISVATDII